MDLKYQIGQHIIIGFQGTEMDEDFISAVKNYKIGNVILFARNITSKNQVKKLVNDIYSLYEKEVGIIPFITIDQEGGMVTRLSEDCVNIAGAMALSATDNKEYIKKSTEINCKQLRELGINCNLAPVLDVNCNKDNPVIGVRSYSDNPQKVATIATNIINTYEENNLLCVGKHFPGHGDTNLDSHLTLPTVDKDLDSLNEMELHPFKVAIDKGLPAIMTSHILYPALEKKGIPATMSKAIITDLLRGKMGFEGLVFSDDMEMNAIKNYYGTAKGVIESLKAGADLMFVSHHPKIAIQVCEEIEKAYKKNEFDNRMWDNSLKRILLFKESYAKIKNIRPITEEDKKYNTKVKEASISLYKGTPYKLNNKPLFISPNLFQATNVSNDFPTLSFSKELSKYFNSDYIISSSNPNKEEIDNLVRDIINMEITDLIFGVYNAHLYKGQEMLIRELKSKDVPLTIVALRNPYDLKNLDDISDVSIAAYEYTKESIEIIARILKKEINITGKIPVSM
ncbi:MAG: beta-N-acetylhexosaminidase [Sphaerochaetaceae bacterium]|nr:beta-N-acetylhexosaminidase [Sphaerochaetaceae bacterium]